MQMIKEWTKKRSKAAASATQEKRRRGAGQSSAKDREKRNYEATVKWQSIENAINGTAAKGSAS